MPNLAPIYSHDAEGDSFACHFDCRRLNLCKGSFNILEWHRGAVAAWKLVAETMGQHGKIAVLSSQNSFKASTPYLFKTHGCPVHEDEVFATMNTSALAMSAWRRFYEYYAHPGPR